MEHNEHFIYILTLLAWAVGVIAFFQRVHLPPILGYLFVGAVVGPGGLAIIPVISEMEFLAEFGVVFLMFSLGLEFSIPRLLAMKRALLGAGGLQVVSCTVVAMLAGCKFANLDLKISFVLAGALALSSTAVVIKQLTEQNECESEHGKLAISILLFQDIAAVIFLVVIPALDSNLKSNVGTTLLLALSKGLGVFLLLALVGQWVLRPLFHQITKVHSRELFMIAALLVALSAAGFTEFMGLSMAFGAFTAGLMLGETEFKHQLEIDIRPFKDVLLGLFFITIGARLDLAYIRKNWDDILIVLLALFILKTALITIIAMTISKAKRITACRTALILSQGGELGFLLLTVAITHGIIDVSQQQTIISALVLSLVIAPLIIRFNSKISLLIFPSASKEKVLPSAIDNVISQQTIEMKKHVIICGYGRVGQTLARFLDQEDIPVIALDLDATRINKIAKTAEKAFYGDTRDPNTLAAAGLARARMLVISFSNEASALETLMHVRNLRIDLPVFVRTKDDKNLKAFQDAGATEVVPESFEASLMLAAHLLLTLGLPTNKIINKIRGVHSNRYQILQGYFEGSEESSNFKSIETVHKSLHAITIPEIAFAVGKTIGEVVVDEEDDIPVKSITRNEKRLPDPSSDTILQSGDVLVLNASLEALALLEEKILRGTD